MAISWRFVGTKSARFETCLNFEAIYWLFFFRLRVANRRDIATSLHRRFNTAKVGCVNGALADVSDKYREIATLSLARSF